MRRELIIPVLLGFATLAVYSQIVEFEFLNFDDNHYVTENAPVRAGLTAAGIKWAFVSGHASNWHPLSWLSHMLDSELFGLDPAGHHLTNLLLHLANTLLLFGLLRRMTKQEGASALVALFFAVHPLHVESVAWVSERKDVLSAFFGLLCMHAYFSYVKNRRRANYVLTAGFLACGLMAKPMLVTLPFVLLLLDYWPLNRIGGQGIGREGERLKDLLAEKLPLFFLAAASSAITLVVQRTGGAMEIGHAVPLHLRLANAVVSYVRYIGKTFWPSELSALYPHPYTPGGLPWSGAQIAGAAALLLAVSVAVVLVKRQRYLLVGWLWYLGMLVPVIGVVQVGGQAMADRYTYLPLIGLLIMLVWGGDAALTRLEVRHARIRSIAALLLCGVGVASIVVARVQAEVWRDSLSLLKHASAIAPGSPIIDNHLGAALQAEGRHQDAIRHYRRSLRFAPDNAKTHSNLGRALQLEGNLDEAIFHYRKALEIAPDYGHALIHLGVAIASQGKLEEGASYFRRAMEFDTTSIELRVNLAKVLVMQGRLDDAIELYEAALVLAPDAAAIQQNLAATRRALHKSQ